MGESGGDKRRGKRIYRERQRHLIDWISSVFNYFLFWEKLIVARRNWRNRQTKHNTECERGWRNTSGKVPKMTRWPRELVNCRQLSCTFSSPPCALGKWARHMSQLIKMSWECAASSSDGAVYLRGWQGLELRGHGGRLDGGGVEHAMFIPVKVVETEVNRQ